MIVTKLTVVYNPVSLNLKKSLDGDGFQSKPRRICRNYQVAMRAATLQHTRDPEVKGTEGSWETAGDCGWFKRRGRRWKSIINELQKETQKGYSMKKGSWPLFGGQIETV